MKALVYIAKISEEQAGSTSTLEHWCAHSLRQSWKATLLQPASFLGKWLKWIDF